MLFVGSRVIWPGVSRASGPNLWERLNRTTALSAVPLRWAGIKYLLKSSTSDKRRRLPRRSALSRLFMLSFTGGDFLKLTGDTSRFICPAVAFIQRDLSEIGKREPAWPDPAGSREQWQIEGLDEPQPENRIDICCVVFICVVSPPTVQLPICSIHHPWIQGLLNEDPDARRSLLSPYLTSSPYTLPIGLLCRAMAA